MKNELFYRLQNPYINDIAGALNIPPTQAIWHTSLLVYWMWRNRQDDGANDVTAEEIENAAMWHGEPHTFYKALFRTGWVEDGIILDRAYVMEIPDGYRLPWHIWKRVRMNVFIRDKYTCKICFKEFPLEELECDHKEPFWRGGSNYYDNLRTACKTCNRKKGAEETAMANRQRQGGRKGQ